MKIAFASCFDVVSDRTQTVWESVSAQQPEALILLGDSVYLDYGFGDRRLGWTKNIEPDEFGRKLHDLYRRQSEVASFRNLVETTQQVFTTWDDHDFAWNASYGRLSGRMEENQAKKNSNFVPRAKRLISRYLHLQFRGWLNTPAGDNGRELPDYPDLPDIDYMLDQSNPDVFDRGVEYCEDIEGFRVIMVDARYYRQRQNSRHSVLGEVQRLHLVDWLDSGNQINLLCTSTPLREGGDAWAKFSDLDWLDVQNLSRTIVLSGDVHDNHVQYHDGIEPGLHEFISSGAARKGVLKKLLEAMGNFGIVESTGAGSIRVTLFDEDGQADVSSQIPENPVDIDFNNLPTVLPPIQDSWDEPWLKK